MTNDDLRKEYQEGLDEAIKNRDGFMAHFYGSYITQIDEIEAKHKRDMEEHKAKMEFMWKQSEAKAQAMVDEWRFKEKVNKPWYRRIF